MAEFDSMGEKETENSIVVAEEQCIETNLLKAKIEKSRITHWIDHVKVQMKT